MKRAMKKAVGVGGGLFWVVGGGVEGGSAAEHQQIPEALLLLL